MKTFKKYYKWKYIWLALFIHLYIIYIYTCLFINRYICVLACDNFVIDPTSDKDALIFIMYCFQCLRDVNKPTGSPRDNVPVGTIIQVLVAAMIQAHPKNQSRKAISRLYLISNDIFGTLVTLEDFLLEPVPKMNNMTISLFILKHYLNCRKDLLI